MYNMFTSRAKGVTKKIHRRTLCSVRQTYSVHTCVYIYIYGRIVIVMLLLNILYLMVARVLYSGSHVRPPVPLFIFFVGHVRNRFTPVRTIRAPFPPATAARQCTQPEEGPLLLRRTILLLYRSITTRDQLVLWSRCTMTALRIMVGVCNKYVKVSGQLIYIFFFSFRKYRVVQ